MIRVEELISSQVGLEFSPDEASKELPDDDEQALSTSLCSHGWAHPVGLAVCFFKSQAKYAVYKNNSWTTCIFSCCYKSQFAGSKRRKRKRNQALDPSQGRHQISCDPGLNLTSLLFIPRRFLVFKKSRQLVYSRESSTSGSPASDYFSFSLSLALRMLQYECCSHFLEPTDSQSSFLPPPWYWAHQLGRCCYLTSLSPQQALKRERQSMQDWRNMRSQHTGETGTDLRSGI
ncbi:hypothetical protein Y1Q_0016749 [Alligator mississippiensis]|uniref:Uncharacterized protein n=1 Tax=Alligator mississippiensis TaxID=8496 RepID=A0A151P639_ALLMI|nr:hypothetical protein Y1Q_0016749 [Alligator mississippiensis]